MNNLTISTLLRLQNALSSRSSTLKVTESTAILFINFCALAGNIILYWAIRRNCRLRQNTTNLFISSLAVSDILMALLCMPFSIGVFILGRWVYGELACQLHGFAFFVLVFVSQETMALIAVNRYLNVTKPAVYRRIFTRTRSLKMIVLAWLVCVIYVGTFAILKWPIFIFDPGKTICHIRLTDRYFKTAWNIITMAVFALAPMATLLFCYWRVLVSVRRHNTATLRSLRAGSLQRSAHALEDVKINKIILGLIAGYFCCWLSAYGISYVELAYPAISVQRFPQTLWAFLVFSSSAINSVIYGILNRTFRVEILKIVTCKKRRRSS
ncbi:melatonin receptor type 1B-B-like [Stylophora pistillata]|uniref:melatonin receptor type 1B-B-like n=1 Tax=Stylophora pistillata TaxID=50429 RepID=UPI000C05771C|nr:melatonin receptor type 1B-B-like [Stylophora pistillata]